MATTTNFGWETPDDTDLVKDGASAIRTLGNGIDTSLLDLKGGTTGQLLSKASNTNMDFSWITPTSGKLLQVVQATIVSTSTSTTSTTYVDTGLSIAITPTASTSKVLAMFSAPTAFANRVSSGGSTWGNFKLVRATTDLTEMTYGLRNHATTTDQYVYGIPQTTYLDSPATTSSTTYKIQYKANTNGTIYLNDGSGTTSLILLEIGA